MSRYAAHSLLAEFGDVGQSVLTRSRVLVIGIGGLGCPAAQYLTLGGVGTIALMDFDVVDQRNLNRQTLFTPDDVGRDKVDVAAKTLRNHNPDVHIRTVRDRFVHTDTHDPFLSTIEEQDCVIDASDNFATRRAVNRACRKAGVPWVMGAAIRFEGQLACFRPDGPCYECVYGDVADSFDDCTGGGIFGPTAGAIGALMAGRAMQELVAPQSGFSDLIAVDTRQMALRSVKISQRDDCPVCRVQPAS